MNIQKTPLSIAIRAALPVRVLWLGALVAALAAMPALAQDDFALEEDDGAAERNAEKLEEQTVIRNSVELGFTHVSEDSFRFGRYTGLEEDGFHPVLGFDIFRRGAWDGDSNEYWRVQGRNLGIESRELSAEYGRQGEFSVWAGYDQQPHYQSDDGRVFFNGAGSTVLTLPSGWVGGQNTAGITQLNANLRPFAIEHERRRFDLGGEWLFRPKWVVSSNYSREQKDGNKTIGLTIGNSGGNPRAVVAPEPVDYLTQQADVTLAYADAGKNFSVGYYVSRFDNENASLVWQNPYSSITGWAPTVVGFPNGQGQMHLEPDNAFHQVNVAGGWAFTDRTRLTGSLSFGRATQDEPFLPYTINPALAASITQALPRGSLDGQVDSTFFNLRLSSRPWDSLWLTASYRYDDRDNKTPHAEYVYIGGDSTTQNTAITSSNRRINEPKSYLEHAFDLDASWRATDAVRVSGEAQFRTIERHHQEREEIDESRMGFSIAHQDGGLLGGGIRLGVADRDGGTAYNGATTFLGGYSPGYTSTLLPLFNGQPFENLPGLRKFNQADRKRRYGEFFADINPTERFALSFSTTYNEDDYDNSEFGLTFSRVNGWNLDATWAATDTTSIYAWTSEERYKNDQDGRSFVGGATRPTTSADPNRNWNTRSRDDVTSHGFGFATRAAEDRLTLGFDWVQSAVKSDVITTVGSALTRAPLPTATSDLYYASGYADWKWTRNIMLRFRVGYEEYESFDWALDGVPPNQLANVVLMGETSPDYEVWFTTATFVYRF